MKGNLTERQQTVNTPISQPLRTAAGDALSVLVVQIFRLSGLLSVTGDALAKPAGQTSARWQVLAAAEDEAKTVAYIARLLGLTRQSVQRVANLLVDDGLASYQTNPGDKRADLFSLTSKGRMVLTEIQARQRAWADALGANIGETDLQQASEIIGRTLAVVEDMNTAKVLEHNGSA